MPCRGMAEGFEDLLHGGNGIDMTVPALKRGLRVLENLARDPYEMKLTELAEELDIPQASLWRILKVLTEHDYVIFDKGRHTYRLGYKFMYLGNIMFGGSHFRSQSRDYLRKLADMTGETASIDVRIRNQLVIVDQVAGSDAVYLWANPGSAMPYLHATAAGKVYLAHTEIDKVHKVMKKLGFAKLTPYTVDSIEKLERELERVKENGFGIDIEEMREGVARVAAPVYDESGKIICCLTVACPAFKLKDEAKIIEYGRMVRKVADEMTANCGKI